MRYRRQGIKAGLWPTVRTANAVGVTALLALLGLLVTPATTVASVSAQGHEQNSVRAAALAADTSCASPAGTTLIECGFETPVLGEGNFTYDTSGSAWSFSNSSGISSNQSGFTDSQLAPEGVQVAFIQGGGQFAQAVDGFLAGTQYKLTFGAAQRLNGGGNQDFFVLLDGALLGSFKPASTTYADLSASFVTTAGTHTLKFLGRDTAGGDNTAFVDNVRLTSGAVPPQVCTTVQGNISGQPANFVGGIQGQLTYIETYAYLSQPPSTLVHHGGVVLIQTMTGALYGAIAAVVDESGPPNNIAALIVFSGGTGPFGAATGRISLMGNLPGMSQYTGTLCTARR
jgi:hypothetical protein